MEAADEVTLLPQVRGWNSRVKVHRAELTTRHEFAALDLHTARLATVPRIDAVLDTWEEQPSATVEDLTTGPSQAARLQELGIDNGRDLEHEDPATLEVLRRLGKFAGLVDAITQARADLTNQIYLKPGVEHLHVPRAEVEVDFDIEWYDETVYLWGARVADPEGLLGSPEGEFVGEFFTTEWPFDPTPLFVQFWKWLTGLREDVREQGRTIAIYCWSGPGAEARFLRHHAAVAGRHLREEVEELLESPEWVDLERVIKDQLVLPARGRTSIKIVAPQLAGFS